MTYVYASWAVRYNRAEGPVTVLSSRTRDAHGAWLVKDVGTYTLWWPWLGPVERDLGDVRLWILPYGAPVEDDAAAWRARAVVAGNRAGVVHAVRVERGISRPVGVEDAAVVAALREWEAVTVLGMDEARGR